MYRAVLFAALLLSAAPCRAGSITDFGLLAGHPRQWLVHLPPHYKRGQPLPLVILYHPKGGTAGAFERATDMDSFADRMHFIAVYPSGFEQTWASHSGTDADAAKIDDVAFTAALLDQLELKYSIDPQRVVLAGFAEGAQMVNLLGCRLADRVTGLVAVAGILSPDAAQDCHPSRALTVIEFHASADPFVPFAGGPSPKGGGNGMGVAANVAGWAAREGCKPTPAKSLLPGTSKFPPAEVQDFGGCTSGIQVRLYEVMGAWHLWFRGQPADVDDAITELVTNRKVP